MSITMLNRAKRIKLALVRRKEAVDVFGVGEVAATSTQLARIVGCSVPTVINTMLRYHAAMDIAVKEVPINRGAVSFKYVFEATNDVVDYELPF